MPLLDLFQRLEHRRLHIRDRIDKEFVHLLETTDMTKVYKMPVLRAFYNEGQV